MTDEKRLAKAKKQESLAIFQGYLAETLGQFNAGYLVSLKLDPDREVLEISGQKKDPTITLPYNRIVSFVVEDETSLVKSGSGIGRALAGGLLFGGAGAVVGAMSGKGKTKTAWYGTLTYKTKEGDTAQIVLKELTLGNPRSKTLSATTFETVVAGIVRRYAATITEL